jgi:tripartite-type tricarboxylate transporter receptor subunit TctC
LPVIFGLSLAAFANTSSQAEDYPNRPIHVVVPYAGGSASDVVARIMLSEMSKTLGQPIVDDNQPGAGGDIGTAAVSRATPDGYTLLITGMGPLAANRTLFKKLDYDPQKDLAPISQFVDLPNIIIINAKLPPRNLTEFIAYAKEHPKSLNYGTVGFGSSQHLSALYFEQTTGTELTHVPYSQIAQFPADFIAGQVPLGFQLYPNVVSLLKSGNARPLAVTTSTRLPILPDVPTVGEAGVKNYESSAWLALLAPAGTPKPIIDKVYNALKEAMQKPATKARYKDLGAEAVSPGPDALKNLIASDTAKWRTVIQKAGIHPM